MYHAALILFSNLTQSFLSQHAISDHHVSLETASVQTTYRDSVLKAKPQLLQSTASAPQLQPTYTLPTLSTCAYTTQPLFSTTLPMQPLYTGHQLPANHIPSTQSQSYSNDFPSAKRPRKYTRSQSEPQSVLSQYQHPGNSRPTPVQQFIDFVKRTYRSSVVESNTSVVKWPPTPSQVYINLACIDRKRVKSNSEDYDKLTKNMVEYGDVDVIRATKEPIKFSEIAKDISITFSKKDTAMSSRRLIIVDGAPGVGKSTFAWEYCRRWERGEIAEQYQLVLLLRLRDNTISEAKSLNDLIYYPLEGVSQAVCEELVHSHNLHTLIILEGFDELPDDCRKGTSVFNDLISGKMLPSATILVTCRPWATQRIRTKHEGRIYQHIEVLGFTGPQVTEYIHKTVREDKVSGLEDYMDRYPQIRKGMYIPLNSAIVVTVYLESQASGLSMPTSLTELYSALGCTLLLRYMRGHPEHEAITSINTFDDLPPTVCTKFSELCKLAYNGIVNKSSQVKLIFKGLPPDFDNLGFMNSVNELYVTRGTVSSHNFLHLTFQEYFAAVHISTLPADKQMEFFQRHKEGIFKVVLKFLSGLNKLNCFTDDIVNVLFKASAPLESVSKHEICSDLTVDVDFINWMYEAQNGDVIASLLGQKTVGFTIKPRGMSLMDYYSLGYCIAHSQCQWMLTIEVKEISEEKIKMLTSGASTEGVASGKVIGLCGGDEDKLLSLTTTKSLNLLFFEWKSILHLHQLYLQISVPYDKIEWPDLSSLQVLKLINKYRGQSCSGLNLSPLPCLKSLTIHTMDLLPICHDIKNIIIDSTNLTELSINNIMFKTDHGFKEITRALANNKSLLLERLEIKSFTDIGYGCPTNTAVNYLIEFITNTKTLKYISIIECTFNAERLLALICAMHQKPTLQVIMETLECSINSDDDAKCFSQLLSDYPDIANNTILNEKIRGVTEIGAVYLAQAIRHNHTFQCIDVFGSNIGDDGAVSLAKALHRNSTLQRLKLNENNIGDAGAVALAEALHHNSTLNSLDLEGNDIGDDGAVALAEALHHNSTLNSLDFHHNNIGEAGAVALAEALHHNSTLNSLDLHHNNIGEAGAVALAEALHRNSTLNSLDLHHNNIGEAGAVALAEALHRNSTLNSLDLHHNNIGEAGAVALAEALHHNSTLNSLNLCHNNIGEAGAVALAEALHHNSTLNSLDLNGNNIGEAGAVALAKALHTLNSLYLNGNNIGDAGAVALAEALHHNSTIKYLNLGGNNIGDAGAVALAEALHHNSTLNSLYLNGNNIGDDGAVALSKALHHNSAIKYLNLFGVNNNIGEKGTHQLVQALTVNKSIDTLSLPPTCEKYTKQCQPYNLVKKKIIFHYLRIYCSL